MASPPAGSDESTPLRTQPNPPGERNYDPEKLTPKEERFVDEYLIDLNATKAAERAGYGNTFGSSATAGYKLLNSERVAKAIVAAKEERSKRTLVTADVVLGELLNIARVDVLEAYDPTTGALRALKEMPETLRRAISGVEFDEKGQIARLKFWNKKDALELLGKHIRLFSERFEVRLNVTLEDILAESNKPPQEGAA